MSTAGGYDPKTTEAEIYAMWEAGGYFHAEPDPSRKPFVITIPPPNVTGALHLGHALNNTLQDILIRRKRMQGFNACWLPGTDHAGIATQAVVERRLREEQGWKRDSSNPEHRKFLVEKIWEWKEDYNARILNQLRRMGCSCDWQRTRFTLDEQCAKAVYETFFRFFKDGLIYRGLRLVNWDTQLQTAVADDEVYHETVRGNLWHIRYPIVGKQGNKETRGQGGSADVSSASQGGVGVSPATGGAGILPADAVVGRDFLIVATTRPETMLADTAVAVHPEDERYKHLHGGQGAAPTHFVMLPLMNRPIPIVADGMLVKKEFGTGCVKVTPGHDPNDYACYQRKLGQADQIGIIDLLTPDGKINENGRAAGSIGVSPVRSESTHRPEADAPLHLFDYAGMKKEDARKKVVADLEALGLLEKIEPYETEIGHSDRSKTPIEPLRSEQWFVKMDKLAESAMEAVRDGRVRFFPERYAKTYLDWLGEKRDWCISRQLWWGHRIPVWTLKTHVGVVAGSPTADTSAHKISEAVKAGLVKIEAFPDCTSGTSLIAALGSTQATPTTSTPILKDHFCPRPEFQSQFAGLAADVGMCQDDNVLDTWFSSALWPHSTFGWPDVETRDEPSRDREGAGSSSALPDKTNPLPYGRGSAGIDLSYFYPTSVLSTAREIITLWVARMVMTGLYNTGRTLPDGSRTEGRVPFQHVYIHAVIQDGHGRRMSKSAGNGVDPLDIIEAYGTDALRFTLAQLATETQDIRIPVKPTQLPDGRTINTSERFELGRNFCNKVYQAATGFILPNIAGLSPRPLAPDDLAIEDRWILSRLRATIEAVDRAIDRYQFADSVQTLYNFFWSDFCDWYVELVKPRLMSRDAGGESVRREDASANAARQVLAWVLDQSLRLLHPAIPYVTEAVWTELNAIAPRRGAATLHSCDKPLIVADWPQAAAISRDAEAEREIGPMQDVIRALREIRTSLNAIRSQAKQAALRTLPSAVVRCNRSTADLLERGRAAIARLGQVDEISFGPDATKPPQSLSKVLTGIEVFVSIAGLADIDIERKRLGKERDEAAAALQRLEAKLANEGFVAKAKPEVIEAERARQIELRDKLAAIARNLGELGS